MYTKPKYTLPDMLRWTKRDIIKFIIISTIPVFLYTVLDFKWLHLPWLPIALVGTALAFIVSFKNNISYQRLWEARQIWGGIVNTSRSFAMMCNDFITNEHATKKRSEEELKEIKKTIVHRHVAWMTAHRYSLRQKKPWEIAMDNEANKRFSEMYVIPEHKEPFDEAVKPYLSPTEFDYIQNKRNKAGALLSLQSKQLRQLKEEGLIWEFSYLELEKMLVEMFTLQGKNERIKNFPYPRQFATLNYYFVWIFILLLPFGVMNEFDKIGMMLLEEVQTASSYGIKQVIYELLAQNFVWISIPFSVVISWIFYTMERIGEASENPFEGTANDVPISSMSRAIEVDIRQILDENAEDIPALRAPNYDVVM